ncbi:MAG: PIN domain protein [Anaerolineaceae bacterium]|nr:PIN domain protein [Anaerolineaceae bacterium]
MFAAVADTHSVIWYLAQDSRLSYAAKLFIDDAMQNGEQVGISSISLVEIVYLIERNRIPAESLSRLAAAIASPRSVLTEVALNMDVVRALTNVDSTQIPDMPDRIIAATAAYLRVPLISRDTKIQLSDLETIW